MNMETTEQVVTPQVVAKRIELWPRRIMYPCSEPGCGALTNGGRCQSHKLEREQLRGSSAKRGYDGRWRKFRLWFLADHPLCQDCGEDHPSAATEVHHVKKVREFPELQFFEDNCMALCHDCHSRWTLRGE